MRRTACLLLLLSGVASAQPAPAQPPPPPEAAKLFEEGRALTKDGKWAEACDKFTKSYALDHAIGTALNLGECHEKQGHLVDAFQFFDEAATASAKTDNDTRTKLARQRADALAARLATIVVKLPDPTGATLSIAGRAVTPAARVEQRVEPGDITVTVTLPGKHPDTRTAHAAAGATAEVDLAPLATTVFPGRPLDTAPTERRHTRVVAGYTFGALGIATFATGVVIGVVAKGRYDDAIKGCSTQPLECPQPYYTQVKDAGTLGDVGTGVGIAGLVMVGIGATLYFTAPRDVVISPTATAQSGGVSISGRF